MKNINTFINLEKYGYKKLIIFTHAGALPIQYINWCQEKLIDNFDIFITKFNPDKILNWQNLIEYYEKDFLNIIDKDSIIFAHSIGALIAFDLLEKHNLKVSKICLSSISPLSYESQCLYKEISCQNQLDFLSTLDKLDGMPFEINEVDSTIEKYLLSIQLFFKILSTAKINQNKIAQEINLIIGQNDRLLNLIEVSKWKQKTTSNFYLKIFPGGHFFIFDKTNQINRYLLELSNS